MNNPYKSFVISDESGTVPSLDQQSEVVTEKDDSHSLLESIAEEVTTNQVPGLDPKLDLISIPTNLCAWFLFDLTLMAISTGRATNLIEGRALVLHELIDDPNVIVRPQIIESLILMDSIVTDSLTIKNINPLTGESCGRIVYKSYDEWILRTHTHLLQVTETTSQRWLKRKAGLVNWIQYLQSQINIDFEDKQVKDFITVVKRKYNDKP